MPGRSWVPPPTDAASGVPEYAVLLFDRSRPMWERVSGLNWSFVKHFTLRKNDSAQCCKTKFHPHDGYPLDIASRRHKSLIGRQCETPNAHVSEATLSGKLYHWPDLEKRIHSSRTQSGNTECNSANGANQHPIINCAAPCLCALGDWMPRSRNIYFLVIRYPINCLSRFFERTMSQMLLSPRYEALKRCPTSRSTGY